MFLSFTLQNALALYFKVRKKILYLLLEIVSLSFLQSYLAMPVNGISLENMKTQKSWDFPGSPLAKTILPMQGAQI